MPIFSDAKLKEMFPTIVDCGSGLEQYLNAICMADELLNVREISERYAINIIVSVAFGLDVNSSIDKQKTFWNRPLNIFSFKTTASNVKEFIQSLVHDTLEYREKNDIQRCDFFQLLIEMRNNGTIHMEHEWEMLQESRQQKINHKKSMTENQLAAHIYVFFVAGFEKIASTFAACLYELANNPMAQRKLHAEIVHVLGEHYGRITFQSIVEMKYLDACVKGKDA